MFVRISVLLLSASLASCQTDPFVDMGATFAFDQSLDAIDASIDIMSAKAPIQVCSRDGRHCQAITQEQADRVTLVKACNLSDESDCWHYAKPKDPNT
ncbi:hypothetical protein WH96_06245 [Kiloniella spongiae]|uniref:Uncharacterized protein n=1 Tax=Kiloniella spongiae TaxID=1489064 RepID=A0A0H2MMA2_9PROT|nr:hypothetical protein [Kiloniella spongiae]KLN61872.1 hypothetical protein WH96_06245 [Kiloniella spongiae]